ncbi:hypothetical protein HHK36_031060 [Tetracentron sinense]|uniref:F-box domain-containing protein n=1 Tax=Tetracentron sinense TaxID=13715 RepID=A0A834Y8X1_TETSI|nr:hypothetical protein HHK36_031060 [Tetracentron sinense]
MKLRIRSLESKETLRIQTPSPSSLQDLKDAISEKISSLPETLHLSLNRKDELDCSSPEESLQSLGITSGDLIFYTLSPNGFSGETLIHTPVIVQASSLDLQEKTENSQVHMFDFNSKETLTLAPNPQQEETLGFSDSVDETPNDLENMNFDDESVVVGKSCSVPCFLSKVFTEDMGNADGDRKLLIIAVHAVMLESGFVCFDPSTEKKIDGFHLPQGWASTGFTVGLGYTLPSLVGSGHGAVESVALKFQVLGKFVTVYGSVTSEVSGSYRVCLDETCFLQSINFVWRNFDSIDAMNEKDGSSKSFHERKVFEFWKIVKDGLALPLLIDLCEKTGLAPPPCLMRLPTELKIRVLELLPGVDMAKVGCVCSELRYLSSNDDLWKQKFAEEFGLSDAKKIQGGSHWKERFTASWENRKKRKRMGFMRERINFQGRIPSVGIPFFPIGNPGIVGGDYDRLPGLHVPAPFGPGLGFPRFPVRRNWAHFLL